MSRLGQDILDSLATQYHSLRQREILVCRETVYVNVQDRKVPENLRPKCYFLYHNISMVNNGFYQLRSYSCIDSLQIKLHLF